MATLFIGVSGVSFAVSLGEAADNAMVPINLFRQAMTGMGVILGFFFCFSGILRYMRHRENPQEQRLSTVIVYFITGLAFFVLTFSYHYAMMADSHFGMADVVQTTD